MKEKFAKLIDVKSIVTLALIATLVYVVVGEKKIDEKTFLLFSNATTMIITYFFTKKADSPQA
jgi:hypothetical protein